MVACQTPTEPADKTRALCLQKTDSLWGWIHATQAQFAYKMDEIAERRQLIDSQLQWSKFKELSAFNEADKQVLLQWAGLSKVYKSTAQTYKNNVLETENLFYEVQGLEKWVKSGQFDQNPEPFKKEYGHLKSEILATLAAAEAVGKQLSGVEPLYHRLRKKVDALMGAQTADR